MHTTRSPESERHSKIPRLDKPAPDQLLQFSAALAPLFVICKPLSAMQVEVYYGLLCDLPAAAIAAAAIEIAASREYPTWPMPGEIRAKAIELITPATDTIQPHEAWKLAWAAACSIDPGNNSVFKDCVGNLWDNQTEYRMSTLPPIVTEAVRRLGGLKLLANADGKFVREQFIRAFNEIVAYENRKLLMLPAVARAIESIGVKNVSGPATANPIPVNPLVRQVAEKIGAA